MREFLRFLAENKAWWITPIVIVLLLLAWLVAGDEPAAPEGGTPFQYDYR